MKKILFAFAFAATLSACHYGTEEAQKTLNDNEKYKSESAGYSVNSANVKAEETAVPATETAPVAADSTTATK
ncbi:MAG: membrane lipoprotein lipid attachment site-containing protein [bacterium]|nr:membrane lipoprotein lipid attachment site-containing protein [bacterium]